jgi:cell division protein FtsI/penicillin-binding protein 2
MTSIHITSKTNRVLQIILLMLIVIFLRIWDLCVLQKEDRLKEARKPQERIISLPAPRGAIVDREFSPLAINRSRYDATIYYSHIRQIPSIGWKKSVEGKKIKYYPRKDYIKKLSEFLAKELSLNAKDLEDLIHAKAALLPHIPFVIKENISEEEYYRLHQQQRHWAGLHALSTFERYYPEGCVASHILGHLGAFSQEEYWELSANIQQLQSFLEEEENGEDPPLPEGYRNQEEIQQSLKELKKRAGCMNDLVGKAGLEKKFEEKLRGSHGKKVFEVDINGNFLRELPQSLEATSGTPLVCSISLELQRFAEALLAEDEKHRVGKSLVFDPIEKKRLPQKQPLIKGGAIVALDPNNGEILALASYPRFNPNDFIPSSNPSIRQKKQKKVICWLETPSYIANLWNGKEKLSVESFHPKEKKFVTEEKELSWELFCETILPKQSPLFFALQQIGTLQNAAALQEDVESLLFFSGQKNAGYLFDLLFVEEEDHILTQKEIPEKVRLQIFQNLNHNLSEVIALKKRLLSFLSPIAENQNKLLLVDLCRLVVNSPAFSTELLETIGTQLLGDYWKTSRAKTALEEEIYAPIFSLFHEKSFRLWREKNEKSFLKQKRDKEKQEKKYAKPYIDYLQEEEKKLMEEFWKENRISFLLFLLKEESSPSELSDYFHLLRTLSPSLPSEPMLLLKKVLVSLSLPLAKEYLKSFRSFEELDRPLLFPYPSLKQNEKEKDLAASFYTPHCYGVSFAYRHGAPLGSIFKIVTGYAALKERYQTLSHPSFSLLNPFTMLEELSYKAEIGKKLAILGHDLQGKAFPQYYKGGRLPRSLHRDAGKIDLISALEQSSNPYFSILATDFLESPSSLLRASKDFGFGEKTGIDLPGEVNGALPSDLFENRTGLYSFAIGQHTSLATPLQTAVMLSALANGGKVLKPQILKNVPIEVLNEVFLPVSIRKMLFEGMDKVVWGEKGSARPSVIQALVQNPALLKEYKDLQHEFIGKTSTAEFTYKSDILPTSKAQKYNDTWFGAIGFDPNASKWEKAELVVVVYLRFGDRGKDAAPLAAQMINKYRELKKKQREANSEKRND